VSAARRGYVARSLIAWLAVLVIVFPFAWIVLSSIKTPDDFLSLDLADALPRSIDLTSYRNALDRADLPRWLFTSLMVASTTALLSIAVAAPMAYALARLRFRGRSTTSGVLVLHYAIPSVTIVVPLFVLLVAAGQYNSLLALVLVHASLTVPFCTWVLRDFYESLPVELEEAGMVDGGGLGQVLRRIVLPLSIPALLAAGAYAFILSWNDFLFAFILIATGDNFTAPVGINAYFTGRNIEQETWAQLMAASTIVSLPSVILFAVFQRYLVSGLLSGSVRG
jgi:multiple sugar transport system permease protein